MSSDNDGPDRRKPYHHGALHSALVDASIALAREGGPDRVILREAARAAGLSHSAAYRHFSDRDALLALQFAEQVSFLNIRDRARHRPQASDRRRSRSPISQCHRASPSSPGSVTGWIVGPQWFHMAMSTAAYLRVSTGQQSIDQRTRGRTVRRV